MIAPRVSSRFKDWSRRRREDVDYQPGDDVVRYAGPVATCETCGGSGREEPGSQWPCPACRGLGEVPDPAQHCPRCWDAGERTVSVGLCPGCARELADEVATCPGVPTHVEGCTCKD